MSHVSFLDQLISKYTFIIVFFVDLCFKLKQCCLQRQQLLLLRCVIGNYKLCLYLQWWTVTKYSHSRTVFKHKCQVIILEYFHCMLYLYTSTPDFRGKKTFIWQLQVLVSLQIKNIIKCTLLVMKYFFTVWFYYWYSLSLWDQKALQTKKIMFFDYFVEFIMP